MTYGDQLAGFEKENETHGLEKREMDACSLRPRPMSGPVKLLLQLIFCMEFLPSNQPFLCLPGFSPPSIVRLAALCM